MAILRWYLLSSVLRTAGITLGLLTFVLVVGNVMTRFFHLLVSSEVPLWYMLEIFLLLIPFSLIFTIPWSLLTGIMIALGRMSSDSELVAARAAGISLAWLTAPVVLTAAGASGICLLMSTTVAPWADARLRLMGLTLAERTPTAMFEPGQVLSVFPGLRIWVEEKQGPHLRNVHVWELGPDDRVVRSLRALRAVVEADASGEGILLSLHGVRVDERDKNQPRDVTLINAGTRFEEAPVRIPLEPLRDQMEERRGLSSLRLDELIGRVFLGRTAADNFNFAPMLTEIQKRVAASLGPLTLALVGIPLAVHSHRRETSVGFALSFAISFGYYFLIVFAESFKEHGAIFPELLIWSPNLVFQSLGVYLFWRSSRS